MSLRYYDEAIAEKIKKWILDPNLRVLKPDETNRIFELHADLNHDKITLPIVALSRDTSFEVLRPLKTQLSFNGYVVGSNEEVSAQLNAIPISTTYQIDIFTRTFEEGDEYVRNFLFNLINHPKLKICIPYNGSNLEHVANLRVLPNVVDNSDIENKLFADQFTRWTIELELQDAYLFDVPINKNWKLDVENSINSITLINSENVDIEETSTSEDGIVGTSRIVEENN